MATTRRRWTGSGESEKSLLEVCSDDDLPTILYSAACVNFCDGNYKRAVIKDRSQGVLVCHKQGIDSIRRLPDQFLPSRKGSSKTPGAWCTVQFSSARPRQGRPSSHPVTEMVRVTWSKAFHVAALTNKRAIAGLLLAMLTDSTCFVAR